MTTGPYETAAGARQAPGVQAIYDTARSAPPGQRLMDAGNARMITTACDQAGLELGAYDRRIIAWLGGWEPEIAAVIAGLITRAAAHRDTT